METVATLPVTEIIASFHFEGFHRWPSALEEVAFLADRHRHVFHVRMWKLVSHTDREVEFILFARKAKKLIVDRYGEPAELDALSCEAVALFLLDELDLSKCEVLEDGENGSLVTR